jgi:outer membrane PBP1 activator LpoA protein
MKIFLLLAAMLLSSCAVDYTTKAGNKIRIETTAESIAILQQLEQGRGYRK